MGKQLFKIRKRCFKFDPIGLALAYGLILVGYYIFIFQGSEFNIKIIILPVVAYYLGVFLGSSQNEAVNNITAISVYWLITIGLFIYGLLCVFASGLRPQTLHLYFQERLLEYCFIPFSASLPWVLNKALEKRKYSILIIINLAIQLLLLKLHFKYNFYIFLIGTSVSYVRVMMALKERNKKRVYFFNCFLFVFLIIVGLLFKNNVFGILDRYYTSFWGTDGGILHNVRYLNLKEAITALNKNGRGGVYISANGVNSSFNMWLDYAKDYGILPFACIIVFEILSLVKHIEFGIEKHIDENLKLLYLTSYVGFHIFFFFEFIAKDVVELWAVELLLMGIVNGNNKIQKEKVIHKIKHSMLYNLRKDN